MAITLRNTKGIALTHNELDGNFIDLNDRTTCLESCASNSITSTQIDNWDCSYSWGDHASAGYICNVSNSDINDLNHNLESLPVSAPGGFDAPVHGSLMVYDVDSTDGDMFRYQTGQGMVENILNIDANSTNKVLCWSGTDFCWSSDGGLTNVIDDTSPELGGDLITAGNRITHASSGTVSMMDFTQTLFGETNHTVLSSVKSIDLFLDSNGGDAGQAFRIYNNQNPDGSVTENTYIFKVSENGDVNVTGKMLLPDGSVSANYAGFGNDDDLKIFHNGNESIIRETGTGSLYLQSDNNVILSKDSDTEIMAKGIADGAVELYYDNVKKFETTSAGVEVTGTFNGHTIPAGAGTLALLSDIGGGGGSNSIAQDDTNVTATDTGTDGHIDFQTENVVRWTVNCSGHIVPNGNACYDIGEAENKVRHFYLSQNSLKFVEDGTNTEYPLGVTGGQLFFNGEQVSGGGGTADNSITWTLTNNSTINWVFSGPGIETGNTDDPELQLIRGYTYKFNNTVAVSHPFEIRTEDGGSAYTAGISKVGDVTTFTVPYDAPDVLVYQCTSHATMLGTIKIVNANNSLQSRIDVSSSGFLVPGTQITRDITGFKGYHLYKITTNIPARVIVYTSAAARTADAGRPEGTDPASDAGVIAEVITTGAETITLSPGVIGYNNEDPVTNIIPIYVTNKTGSPQTTVVTLTVVQTEA